MTRRVVLTAGIIALATGAAAQDVTFRKSKITDAQGKERKVDLTLEGAGKSLVVRQNKTAIAFVPYTAIDQLAYSYSKRRRVKEGVELMTGGCSGGIACIAILPVSVVSGSVLMFTKIKSHWFYIDYTDVNGPRELVLRLDKSEYQKVIDAAKAQTGKDIQILPEQ